MKYKYSANKKKGHISPVMVIHYYHHTKNKKSLQLKYTI